MKILYVQEKEYLCARLRDIPVISACNAISQQKDGFLVSLSFTDDTQVTLDVTVLKRAYPSIIAALEEKEERNRDMYPVVMAPYISNESAALCKQRNIGYMDLSGNCRLTVHSLYIYVQGIPNAYSEKRRAGSIFDPSSSVSSFILRELMRDVSYRWKLSHLAEKLNCSIGQVFKVKDYLVQQLWAEMDTDGLKILEPRAVMQAWSEAYEAKASTFRTVNCYTLLSVPEFEAAINQIHEEFGIACYLTGFAGGVRYAPVVRYNKIHLLIRFEELTEFLKHAPCKQVNSRANVQIHVVDTEVLLHDARIIQQQLVASPVQVYLDCMRLEGRGEEMAEAILTTHVQKVSSML